MSELQIFISTPDRCNGCTNPNEKIVEKEKQTITTQSLVRTAETHIDNLERNLLGSIEAEDYYRRKGDFAKADTIAERIARMEQRKAEIPCERDASLVGFDERRAFYMSVHKQALEAAVAICPGRSNADAACGMEDFQSDFAAASACSRISREVLSQLTGFRL